MSDQWSLHGSRGGRHYPGGETGRAPCECRRHRHELLPQAGPDRIRWARCQSCGALTRWSETPVPGWLERHSVEAAVIGLAAVLALLCLMGEVFP